MAATSSRSAAAAAAATPRWPAAAAAPRGGPRAASISTFISGVMPISWRACLGEEGVEEAAVAVDRWTVCNYEPAPAVSERAHSCVSRVVLCTPRVRSSIAENPHLGQPQHRTARAPQHPQHLQHHDHRQLRHLRRVIGSFYGKPARAAPISAKYRARAEMLAGKTEKPYGAWPSPVTAKFITGSSTRLGSPRSTTRTASTARGPAAGEGSAGRRPLRAVVAVGARRRRRDAVGRQRARVHEYGGGARRDGAFRRRRRRRLLRLRVAAPLHPGDGSEPVC